MEDSFNSQALGNDVLVEYFERTFEVMAERFKRIFEIREAVCAVSLLGKEGPPALHKFKS
jgi:hypothetical protein